MMPTYRLSESFGLIRPPDEYGYYLGTEAAAEHEVSCGLCTAGGEYVPGEDGDVTALRLANGSRRRQRTSRQTPLRGPRASPGVSALASYKITNTIAQPHV